MPLNSEGREVLKTRNHTNFITNFQKRQTFKNLLVFNLFKKVIHEHLKRGIDFKLGDPINMMRKFSKEELKQEIQDFRVVQSYQWQNSLSSQYHYLLYECFHVLFIGGQCLYLITSQNSAFVCTYFTSFFFKPGACTL